MVRKVGRPKRDFSIDKSIGQRIKKARIDAGYTTQQSFADKLDVSISSVRNWENGRNLPDDKWLKEISNICNVDFEWLKYDFQSSDFSLLKKYGDAENVTEKQDVDPWYDISYSITKACGYNMSDINKKEELKNYIKQENKHSFDIYMKYINNIQRKERKSNE